MLRTFAPIPQFSASTVLSFLRMLCGPGLLLLLLIFLSVPFAAPSFSCVRIDPLCWQSSQVPILLQVNSPVTVLTAMLLASLPSCTVWAAPCPSWLMLQTPRTTSLCAAAPHHTGVFLLLMISEHRAPSAQLVQ